MGNKKVRTGSRTLTMLFLYTLIFAPLLILSGCTATATKIQDIQQRAIKSMRDPGEKLVSSPEKTAETYSCKAHTRSRLFLEHVEVIPNRVSPGDEVNQRIRYAFCPSTPSGMAKGQIIRTVLFRGEAMFQDVTNYEFKPGTWAVDAFIVIPGDAQSGVYAIDVVLRYGRETIRRSNSFMVKGR